MHSAHPRAREMEHAVTSLHGMHERLAVEDVPADHREVLVRCEELRAGFLQRGIVVRVEVIETDDGRAAFEERLRRVEADEARGTGDENFHGCESMERMQNATLWRYADAEVCETGAARLFRLVDVPYVEEGGAAHRLPELREVHSAELVPLGEDNPGVRALRGFEGGCAVGHALREDLFRIRRCNGDRKSTRL